MFLLVRASEIKVKKEGLSVRKELTIFSSSKNENAPQFFKSKEFDPWT
jgi:hypothetical protein